MRARQARSDRRTPSCERGHLGSGVLAPSRRRWLVRGGLPPARSTPGPWHRLGGGRRRAGSQLATGAAPRGRTPPRGRLVVAPVPSRPGSDVPPDARPRARSRTRRPASPRRAWAYKTGRSLQLAAIGRDGTSTVAPRRQAPRPAADGTLRWAFATKDTIFSSPALARRDGLRRSDDDHLYALDAAHRRAALRAASRRVPTQSGVGPAPAAATWTPADHRLDGTITRARMASTP